MGFRLFPALSALGGDPTSQIYLTQQGETPESTVDTGAQRFGDWFEGPGGESAVKLGLSAIAIAAGGYSVLPSLWAKDSGYRPVQHPTVAAKQLPPQETPWMISGTSRRSTRRLRRGTSLTLAGTSQQRTSGAISFLQALWGTF